MDFIIIRLTSFLLTYKYFLITWLLINLVATFFIKSCLEKYYLPAKRKITVNNEEKVVDNVHELYPEFKRQDKQIGFFKLYFAFCTYTWIRATIWLGLLCLTYIKCK